MIKYNLVKKSSGLILAHSIKLTNKTLRKGKIILKEDINDLINDDIKKIYVFQLKKEHIREDTAANKLANYIIGNNIIVKKPINGRADFYSKTNGMLHFNVQKLIDLNLYNDDIAISMLKSETIVKKNQLLGNVKVLPYAIKEEYIKKNLKKNISKFINVIKPKLNNITLIISSNDQNLKLQKKIINSLDLRLQAFNLKITNIYYNKHSLVDLENSLKITALKKPDLLMIFGSTSIVDKNDIIPQAIKNQNGKIISFGAPTDPGNLLLLGSLKDIKLIGVPGCAKSIQRNGFDVILEKLCYGLKINKKTIAEMSNGGLYKNLFKA